MKNNIVVNNFLQHLDSFIESKERNLWIELDELKIYVRQSKRYYRGTIIDCIDLASIEVVDQGKGLFTHLLDAIDKKYESSIFVESLLNKRLYKFLLKKGFVVYESDPNSVIKIK